MLLQFSDAFAPLDEDRFLIRHCKAFRRPKRNNKSEVSKANFEPSLPSLTQSCVWQGRS